MNKNVLVVILLVVMALTSIYAMMNQPASQQSGAQVPVNIQNNGVKVLP